VLARLVAGCSRVGQAAALGWPARLFVTTGCPSRRRARCGGNDFLQDSSIRPSLGKWGLAPWTARWPVVLGLSSGWGLRGSTTGPIGVGHPPLHPASLPSACFDPRLRQVGGTRFTADPSGQDLTADRGGSAKSSTTRTGFEDQALAGLQAQPCWRPISGLERSAPGEVIFGQNVSFAYAR